MWVGLGALCLVGLASASQDNGLCSVLAGNFNTLVHTEDPADLPGIMRSSNDIANNFVIVDTLDRMYYATLPSSASSTMVMVAQMQEHALDHLEGAAGDATVLGVNNVRVHSPSCRSHVHYTKNLPVSMDPNKPLSIQHRAVLVEATFDIKRERSGLVTIEHSTVVASVLLFFQAQSTPLPYVFHWDGTVDLSLGWGYAVPDSVGSAFDVTKLDQYAPLGNRTWLFDLQLPGEYCDVDDRSCVVMEMNGGEAQYCPRIRPIAYAAGHSPCPENFHYTSLPDDVHNLPAPDEIVNVATLTPSALVAAIEHAAGRTVHVMHLGVVAYDLANGTHSLDVVVTSHDTSAHATPLTYQVSFTCNVTGCYWGERVAIDALPVFVSVADVPDIIEGFDKDVDCEDTPYSMAHRREHCGETLYPLIDRVAINNGAICMPQLAVPCKQPSISHASNNLGAFFGGTAGAAVLALVVVVSVFAYRRRRQPPYNILT
jgi:hypothetical protein